MNYFNYLESLEPNPNLKAKTEEAIINEINKKNISIKKKRIAYLSTAACFVLLATTVFTAKTMTTGPNIIQNGSDITTSNVANSSTENNNFGENISNSTQELQSSKPTQAVETSENSASTNPQTSQNTNSGNKILINTSTDGNKYGAQKIILNNKVYVQYCSNSKDKWGDDNGNITINKSDIGNLICTISAENLIDLEQWYNYSTMTSSQAKDSKFNKAEIYEYTQCKNKTRLLVKANNDYYIFYLSDLTDKASVNDILDIYTASNSNPIKRIDVIENKDTDTENTDISRKIKDEATINSIIASIKSCNSNYNLKDIISKGFTKNDVEKYTLVLIFEDNSELRLGVHQNYFVFSVVQKNDYGYFELSKNNYDSLVSDLNG